MVISGGVIMVVVEAERGVVVDESPYFDVGVGGRADQADPVSAELVGGRAVLGQG